MAIVILTAEAFAALHGLAQRVSRLNAKNPEIGAGMLADLVERAGKAERLGVTRQFIEGNFNLPKMPQKPLSQQQAEELARIFNGTPCSGPVCACRGDTAAECDEGASRDR